MATIGQLHIAIMKGQYALVGELAYELRNMGVDLTKEITFAHKLYKINGGNYKKVVDALEF